MYYTAASGESRAAKRQYQGDVLLRQPFQRGNRERESSQAKRMMEEEERRKQSKEEWISRDEEKVTKRKRGEIRFQSTPKNLFLR